MKKISGLFISIGIVIVLLSIQTIYAQELMYYKKIEPPKTIIKDTVSVLLDDDVYLNTEDDFSDIRIYDDEDKEIPYAIRKVRLSKGRTEKKGVYSKVISLFQIFLKC